jgi:hypothetical protein
MALTRAEELYVISNLEPNNGKFTNEYGSFLLTIWRKVLILKKVY